MPCYDGRDEIDRDNLAVVIACEVLTERERKGLPIPDYMKSWWESHKKYDAKCGRPHPENWTRSLPKRKVRK